jgi:repressor LexA
MLTRRQNEVLSFLAAHIKAHGFAPSYEEIARALNMGSKSGVHHILRQLDERGHIRRLPGRARAIEIIRQPVAAKGAE